MPGGKIIGGGKMMSKEIWKKFKELSSRFPKEKISTVITAEDFHVIFDCLQDLDERVKSLKSGDKK